VRLIIWVFRINYSFYFRKEVIKIKLSKIILLLVLSLIFVTGSAHALLLTLDDGTNQLTLSDGADPNTGDGGTGFVVINSALGGWVVNVTTGLSKPILGGPFEAELDLNSVDVSSANAGTLTIMLTDTFYYTPNGPAGDSYATSLIGGTTNGSVTATSYLNNNNEAYGTQTELAQFGAFSSSAFSDGVTELVTTSEPFSLTWIAKIVHTSGGQVTSFDANVSIIPTPEPASMMLFGTGLIGLAGFGRKFLFKNKT